MTAKLSQTAALPAALVLAVVLGAAAAAAPARAQEAAGEDALAALADIYELEPARLEADRRVLEALASRDPEDAERDAALALALARGAEQRRDASGAAAAASRAEAAVARAERSTIAIERSVALASLIAARLDRRPDERARRLEVAVRYFTVAVGRGAPDRWLDLFRFGNALAEQGRLPDAETALVDAADALASGPAIQPPARAAAAFRAMGRALAELGLLRDAVVMLDKAAAGGPGPANVELAEAVARLGDHKGALAALAGVPGAGRARARLRVALGEPDAEALKELEAATAGPAPAGATPDAELLALRAGLKRLAGDAAGAEADLAAARKASALVPLVHAEAAEQLLKRGDAPKAVSAAAVAAFLDPRNPLRQELSGRALEAAKDAAGAAAARAQADALRKRIAAAASDGRELPAATLVGGAAALLAQGRPEEALARLAGAGDVAADDGEALAVRLRALIAAGGARGDDPRPTAAALIARAPGVHDLHALAAAAAQARGDVDLARKEVRRALDLEPTNKMAQGILAKVGAGRPRAVPSPAHLHVEEPLPGGEAPWIAIGAGVLGVIAIAVFLVRKRARRPAKASGGYLAARDDSAPWKHEGKGEKTAEAAARPKARTSGRAPAPDRAAAEEEEEDGGSPFTVAQAGKLALLAAITIGAVVWIGLNVLPPPDVDTEVRTRPAGPEISIYAARTGDQVVGTIPAGTKVKLRLGFSLGGGHHAASQRLVVSAPPLAGGDKPVYGCVDVADLVAEDVAAAKARIAAARGPSR